MRRMTTALVLVLLLSGICVTGICTVNHHYKKIDRLLDGAIDCYEQGDLERAAALAVDIENQWVQSERYLSLFVNHDTVDEVGVSISKLEPLALSGDWADYLAACKNAHLQILHIRENEKVNFLNLL
ncbi:MAG: DUF4363 family protein [Clostridiales bacterium]|nr:DUF4363 family protein [Clostridiales bacterium]